MKNAKKFIEKQLKDLDVPSSSAAYSLILENAVEAADIMTRAELVKYIEEYAESLPAHSFEGA